MHALYKLWTENTKGGVSILEVLATDEDFNDNGRVSYYLHNNAQSLLPADEYFQVKLKVR